MKKNSIAFLLLVSVCSFLPDLSGITANMKSFKWLQGSWQMQTRRGIIVEKWAVANDSTLAGESMMTGSDGTEIPLEKIQLAFRNGSYYYIPTVRNQNGEQPVEFKITSYSETGFVAENTQHDFPKRISYTLVNSDSIHAVIDDGAAAPVKKSNFYYSRKKE
ncbi:DUF6265 family protein [Lacibacter sp. H407]|uniref:DUF6265 family protein n=1 Tax=Lacibacter sp. H407 TaxID=3133423 RepID=UPI0030C5A0BB